MVSDDARPASTPLFDLAPAAIAPGDVVRRFGAAVASVLQTPSASARVVAITRNQTRRVIMR